MVTARRTDERLQTTPVAVTAVTPQMLTTRQISTVNDLQTIAPALNVAQGGTGPSSTVQAAIRGQGQPNPGGANDSPVGIYVDGVYIARPLVSNLNALDFAQIEVLRGPQGTLFGRNTTGGAINATTQAPTTDKIEGYVKAGIGNYSQRLVEGVLNLPLSDDLAVRFAGRYGQRDGYIKNLATGRREADVSGDYFGRASLLWEPSALPITLRIIGDYTHYRDNGTPSTLRGADGLAALEGLGAYLDTTHGFYESVSGVNRTGYGGLPIGSGASGDPKMDRAQNYNEAKGVSANLDIDLGEVTVKSITAYRHSKTTNTWDLDGSPSANFVFPFYSKYFQSQFSQEVQASGDFGDLEYTVGGIYFREHGSDLSDSYNYGAPALIPVAPGVFFPFPGFGGQFSRDFTNYVSVSKGLFAQINYHITDRLRATAGIRYTWDSRSIDKHALQAVTDPSDYIGSGQCGTVDRNGLPAAGGCSDPFSAKFHYPAWTAVLDYEFSQDVFGYLKTSGAALSGGFNTRAIPSPSVAAFRPEKVKDIEAGLKADLFDHHLRTNFAVFYSTRKGLQTNVNTLVGGRNTQFIVNAGEARIYGLEFDGTLLAWPGMEINASAAYLHARYHSFLVDNAAGTGMLDRSNERVPQAPTWSLSIGATQTFDVSWGKVAVHGDYAYISSRAYLQDTYDASLGAAGPTPETVVLLNSKYGVIPGYGQFNARVTLTLNDPDIEFALWGRNLTQTHYYKSVFAGLYEPLGAANAAQGDPRTYGGTVSFKF